jgi:Tfp pilus assembly protein PilO
MTMVRRVIDEHRRIVGMIGAGLIANVLAFALLVHPLQRDVATVEQRTRAAEEALAGAQAEHARANGTLTGKDRALKELDTFYTTVLAPDLPGARRLTYARLAQLAERSNLGYERGKYTPVAEKGSTLTRFRVNMELAGSYASIRDFIHAIETAKEFVVIDSVGIAKGVDDDGALRLTLDLSTYFRNAPAKP